MKKHRRLLLLLAAFVGGYAAWLAWPRPGVTMANYDRVQPAMTWEQVEDLFGGPPAQYLPYSDGGPRSFPGTWVWAGADELSLSVEFDDEGRVDYTTSSVRGIPRLPPPSLLDRWRRWVHGLLAGRNSG